MDSKKTIYYANNLEEVFYQLKTIAKLQIVGGCTGNDDLADNFLSVRNLLCVRFHLEMSFLLSEISFFLSGFFSRKDLLSVRYLLSVRFPSEHPSFCQKSPSFH